jgi:histone demethylase JARID1
MAKMTELEEKLQLSLRQKGVVQEQREVFELASDEDRLCSVCSTYCFLSAVRCPCNPKKLACAFHGGDMCDCSPSKKVLRYRYTIQELYGMLKGVQMRSQSYKNWYEHVEKILDGVGSNKTGK